MGRLRSSSGQAWTAGLVFLAMAAAYLPATLSGLGFVSDDFMILQRLRQAGGLEGALPFFSQSYYDYYRPLGFLSFAADWSLWGDWPAAYHATSLALHLVNTLLVLMLARRVVGPGASLLAAAIFGLHPANTEAVYWASARFDLLATALALGALLALAAPGRPRVVPGALLYLAALLAKESVVAVPVAAVAYAWLVRGERPAALLRLCAWLGGAGVVYVVLRQASGLPPAGGVSRLPKLVVLAALLLLQFALAHPAAGPLRRRLLARRNAAAALAVLALAGAGALAAAWPPAGALRGAFTSLGFAAVHLVSPIPPDRWLTPLPWWLGPVGAAVALALVAAARRFAAEPVPAFLAFFAAAAFVPVSSMTEGTRYLYLACVPLAIFAAWAFSALAWHPMAARRALAVVLVAAFAWQIAAKGQDWLWASRMTARAASAIAGATGPGCRGAHVVLATAPVRPRGVHANLNHEALATLADCRPERFTTIVRTAYDTPPVEASIANDGLTLRIDRYAGGFVTSGDLQRFTVAIDRSAPTRLTNPFGAFEAMARGSSLAIRQSLAPGDAQGHAWFVFSGGELRQVVPGP